MTIGERIARCRKTKNLSQEYVAEQLDVTRQAVSKWETDVNVPDTQNFIKLAKLFGTTVEYLACGDEVINLKCIEESCASTEDKVAETLADNTKKNPKKEKGIVIQLLGLFIFALGVIPIILTMRYAPTFFEILPFLLICFLGWKLMM